MKRWSYGITTVPSRVTDLLPKTIASLNTAGFFNPRLFVDGESKPEHYSQFNLEVTTHYPTIRTMGNWGLALAELYLRDPGADLYAVFQDDLIAVRNLRHYLECYKYPERGYWNLYTFPINAKLAKRNKGWFQSNQRGLGAVGLVFNREAVVTLLTSRYLYDRVQDQQRGWRSIDGGIVSAYKQMGWREYCHNPSLIQHTGVKSSMRNKPQQKADTFPGENFDALELIQ